MCVETRLGGEGKHSNVDMHSYSNLPCTNTDGAQQFTTRWGYEGEAGVGESESKSSSVECSTSCLVKMEQIRSVVNVLYRAIIMLNKPRLNHCLHIQTNQPEAVLHSPKVDLSDQWFVVVFLILPLVGGLHFDSRQFFSPTPPLDSSAARFRSRLAR